MSQLNANYIIDTAILLALLTFTTRIVLVRLDRAAYFRRHKYKPDANEYSNVLRITSAPVIAISSSFLLLTAIKVGFDVHDIVNSNESSRYGFLLFGAIGVILFYCLIAWVVLHSLGFSINLRHGAGKDEDKTRWLT